MGSADAFGEGFASPIIALVMITFQNAAALIPKTPGTLDVSGIFLAITIVTWIIFLGLGLSNKKYAAEYAIGAIAGLVVFGSAVASVYPQALTEAIIEAVLVIVGIALSLVAASRG
jgi:hypothetical protein